LHDDLQKQQHHKGRKIELPCKGQCASHWQKHGISQHHHDSYNLTEGSVWVGGEPRKNYSSNNQERVELYKLKAMVSAGGKIPQGPRLEGTVTEIRRNVLANEWEGTTDADEKKRIEALIAEYDRQLLTLEYALKATLSEELDSRSREGSRKAAFAGSSNQSARPGVIWDVLVQNPLESAFLFGLGFDTATEIGLLVLAGSSVVAGLPWWAIISLPLFFAGGMSLLDTIDGSFMNFAYGWAFSKPVRKVYYNIIITGLSVAVAFFVGGLEICQVIAGQLNLSGGFWDYALAFNLNSAGYFIVGAFVVVWSVALLLWRYGKIEERWHNKAHQAQLARGENTDHAAAGMELGPIRDGFKID
jgi:hypothetical protein